jgi:integrase
VTERTKYLDRAKTGQIYFRINGKRIERLPDDEASPEFAAAYGRLMAAHDRGELFGGTPRRARQGSMVGSIEWFVQRYLESKFFVGKDGREPLFSAGSQLKYRPALDDIRRRVGAAKLADMTPEGVDRYLAGIERERSPSVASLHKILLSNLWKFARGFKEFNRGGRTNPTADVGELYRVQHEHRPWPQDVQDRFLAACDENLYFAYYLLLCTGQRVSDVVEMKWTDFDGTHFRLVPKKTKRTAGTVMRIKAPKVLLDLLERRERVHEHILTNSLGQPYTALSVSNMIHRVLVRTGDCSPGTKGRLGKTTDSYSVHGLRKNAGIMLAENGATVPQIMAALGHTTPKLALYYCRLANQKTLNDQAVAIMDDVFDRRAEQRRKATRTKLRVLDKPR